MCNDKRYGRVLRLLGWAHVILFWLCAGLAVALEWRPLGTLDFVRLHCEMSWTAPAGAAKGEPPP